MAAIWICLAVFVVAAFALSMFSISETGAKFLNSTFWYYCSRGLLSAVFILLAFFKRKLRVPPYATVFLIAYVVLLWVEVFLPVRMELFADNTWLVAAAAVSIIAAVKKKDKRQNAPKRLDFAIGYVFLSNLMFLKYYKTLDGNAFILTAALTGAAALIAAVILTVIFKDRIKTKQNRIWIPLCALVFTVFFSYYSLSMLNFCFDFSEPVIQNVVIVEKKIRSGSRQPTYFDLVVMIDGEQVAISVQSDIYYDYEKGDFVNISTYKGFLNRPYYMFGELFEGE